MHPDLDHLLELQKLDAAAVDARRTIATAPERSAALDSRLEEARSAVAAVRDRKTANEAARRDLEKDIAALRARRSKYTDQTMEVKTNREFHALQTEIATADEEIKKLEDKLLENMMDADEIAAAGKATDQGLKDAERGVAAERQALERERDEAAQSIERIAQQRASVAAALPGEAVEAYEKAFKQRRGIAMAEARDGLCSVCHVRIRPQVYQEVRYGDHIVQCESCQRILYYVPPKTAQPDASA